MIAVCREHVPFIISLHAFFSEGGVRVCGIAVLGYFSVRCCSNFAFQSTVLRFSESTRCPVSLNFMSTSPPPTSPPGHGSFTWFCRHHDCERQSSSRPDLLACARLYYLARPTKTAMLRRLVCALCPSNPKGSPDRSFETLNTEPS